jgi:hypothetical protein
LDRGGCPTQLHVHEPAQVPVVLVSIINLDVVKLLPQTPMKMGGYHLSVLFDKDKLIAS